MASLLFFRYYASRSTEPFRRVQIFSNILVRNEGSCHLAFSEALILFRMSSRLLPFLDCWETLSRYAASTAHRFLKAADILALVSSVCLNPLRVLEGSIRSSFDFLRHVFDLENKANLLFRCFRGRIPPPPGGPPCQHFSPFRSLLVGLFPEVVFFHHAHGFELANNCSRFFFWTTAAILALVSSDRALTLFQALFPLLAAAILTSDVGVCV